MSPTLSLHLMVRNLPPGQRRPKIAQAIGEESAGRLQRVLLERALRLPDRGFSARILWFDDDLDSDLQALAVALGWSLMSQPAGDPGERMRRIAALGLAESEAVLLIRHDCPVLDGDYLEAACTALGRHQAVLGPVERGGYALLGLTRIDPLLFESMPWGGDRLLALTCERLRQLGWEHHLLPALWDVDRPEDLPRLAALGVVL
ncbi:TIGR04282 family arsenosugar biosynthesis glycosyltransferase [Pseudomonas aeruginosa]|uniref:TIGR04282 family arsenosugar biosynthesis glycosyltransferase n=1 Tax=Pseudomonas aeruginosa TaxID=287 RepID=UPI00030625AF|nr:TIGR04282 family arsenosugar biosynthesis glycosyltransferase [Pseudomonas aeruginosa]AKF98072.1 hypothetical protein YH69_08670 [Pseudomonas aeruginosa]AWZ83410.1 hypothetical protein CSC41_3206 [Pseudomonas aeruginosa]EIU3312347.1 TIGR04282 family arsenosugar biosynthesis glycosyltransferase [Pseudomonas aeruginosa]EIU6858461.1 DUF2064 domain-containing protein [Pseudomonas aeruginosa]EIU6967837.1 DUF2064 domain-containing protein [Pseudomonas aeruginosa]